MLFCYSFNNIIKAFQKSILKRYLSYLRYLISKFTNYNISPKNYSCWDDQHDLLKDSEIKIIIDVGANRGFISKKYKKMFPKARIISIEAIEEFCIKIKNNFDWSEVYNFALSDTCSKQIFNINSSKDVSSLLETDLNLIPKSYKALLKLKRKVSVDGVTLDKLTSDIGIDKINILKLDIQGGELKALKGAERLLRNNQIDLIFTETFFIPFYKEMPLFGDISSYLLGFGYKFHGLYNEVNSGTTGRLQWCDAIFVSPNYAKISKNLLSQSMRNIRL